MKTATFLTSNQTTTVPTSGRSHAHRPPTNASALSLTKNAQPQIVCANLDSWEACVPLMSDTRCLLAKKLLSEHYCISLMAAYRVIGCALGSKRCSVGWSLSGANHGTLIAPYLTISVTNLATQVSSICILCYKGCPKRLWRSKKTISLMSTQA